jgi:hypothetical protein
MWKHSKTNNIPFIDDDDDDDDNNNNNNGKCILHNAVHIIPSVTFCSLLRLLVACL